MSAWIRSVTGRAYHFKPLNAKQLERPSPFLPLLEVFERVGCEPVEETSQGFDSLSPELKAQSRSVWGCKSSLAHHFCGAEATADRHPTFNRIW
jgi:hypothetical protein